MGAAEQQRVDAGVLQGCQEPLGEHVDLVAAGVASLDELDETGTGRTAELHTTVRLVHRALICARANGADRADHTHVAVAGGRHQRAHSRLDDADHRHIERRTQFVERRGRRRVARHDDELHVVFLDEKPGDLVGIGPNLDQRSRPIRIARRVADVDEILARQQVDQHAGHGETTEAAVEHANGAIVHDGPG